MCKLRESDAESKIKNVNWYLDSNWLMLSEEKKIKTNMIALNFLFPISC